jgi:hypothetical protein
MQNLTPLSNVGHKPGHNDPMSGTTQNWSEDRLQQECVMWFKNTFRPIRKLLYMNHNSGKKNIATATRDVAMGLTKGVPDLFLAIPMYQKEAGKWSTVSICGLYIEMKTPSGKLSSDQTLLFAQLKSQGYRCEVVTSLEQFKAIILDYLANTMWRDLLNPNEIR